MHRTVFPLNDCLQVVNTTKDGRFSPTSAAAIHDDCNTLWLDSVDVSIEHYYREANQVAHESAKDAFASKISCNWGEESLLATSWQPWHMM